VVEPTSLEPAVAELPSLGCRGRRYTTSTDVTLGKGYDLGAGARFTRVIRRTACLHLPYTRAS